MVWRIPLPPHREDIERAGSCGDRLSSTALTHHRKSLHSICFIEISDCQSDETGALGTGVNPGITAANNWAKFSMGVICLSGISPSRSFSRRPPILTERVQRRVPIARTVLIGQYLHTDWAPGFKEAARALKGSVYCLGVNILFKRFLTQCTTRVPSLQQRSADKIDTWLEEWNNIITTCW